MLNPGTVLQNRYRILRILGQGGMGAVYLAEDLRLNRWLAVKEMLPDPQATYLERQQAQQQFQLEATMLAKLDHPNLPKVYDCLEEGGSFFLAMDFVDGETLEHLLATTPGALPQERVLGWAAQLCDVLAYLHSQQPPIIFRDLKPANIMLDRHGRIKLIDFGIARLFKPGKQTDTLRMGTLGYAPPEQYAGRGQTDKRSDIFSLGATLHHLLTGRDPKAEMPFTFSSLLPRKVNTTVTPAVEAAVMKAVAFDAADRFQTVAEMKQALLGGSPARTGLTTYLSGPARIVVPAVAVVAVGLLAWLGLRAHGPSPTPPPSIAWVTTIAGSASPANGLAPGGTAALASVGTPTPVATATARPTRTAAATTMPSATPMPTNTPLPAPTETPVLAATSCPAAQGLFVNLAARYSDRLGCLQAGWETDRSYPPATFAEQLFQGGHMFWFNGPPKEVWVVYGAGTGAWQGSGQWQQFSDTWQDGDPDFSCPQQYPYPQQPKGGFGKVWCEHPDVRQRLGLGTGAARDLERESPGNNIFRLQRFAQGFIFRDSDGWAHGMAYVFFADGSFVRDSY
jgi:hypothetical protein